MVRGVSGFEQFYQGGTLRMQGASLCEHGGKVALCGNALEAQVSGSYALTHFCIEHAHGGAFSFD